MRNADKPEDVNFSTRENIHLYTVIRFHCRFSKSSEYIADLFWQLLCLSVQPNKCGSLLEEHITCTPYSLNSSCGGICEMTVGSRSCRGYPHICRVWSDRTGSMVLQSLVFSSLSSPTSSRKLLSRGPTLTNLEKIKWEDAGQQIRSKIDSFQNANFLFLRCAKMAIRCYQSPWNC